MRTAPLRMRTARERTKGANWQGDALKRLNFTVSPRSDQRGLITLEWIILVGAVTGIVTMVLIFGWAAIFDRTEAVAPEADGGIAESARRAADEATSGRRCELLEGLYDNIQFQYVKDPRDPSDPDYDATDPDKCSCEVVESVDVANWCVFHAVAPQPIPDQTMELDTVTPNVETFPLDQAFFNKDASITPAYGVVSGVPTSVTASIDHSTNELTVTAIATTSADGATITVTAFDDEDGDDTLDATEETLGTITFKVIVENPPGPTKVGEFEDIDFTHATLKSRRYDEYLSVKEYFSGVGLTFEATSSKPGVAEVEDTVIGYEGGIRLTYRNAGTATITVTATEAQIPGISPRRTVNQEFDVTVHAHSSEPSILTSSASIPTLEIFENEDSYLDLSAYFMGPNLAFGLTSTPSSDPSIVTVETPIASDKPTTIKLTGQAIGTAIVTIVAFQDDDGDGTRNVSSEHSAIHQFTVSVVAKPDPPISINPSNSPISDGAIHKYVGMTYPLNDLKNYFNNANGSTNFTAGSFDSNIAELEISGHSGTIKRKSVGDTILSLRASNPYNPNINARQVFSVSVVADLETLTEFVEVPDYTATSGTVRTINLENHFSGQGLTYALTSSPNAANGAYTSASISGTNLTFTFGTVGTDEDLTFTVTDTSSSPVVHTEVINIAVA